MRITFTFVLAALAALALVSPALDAQVQNPGDYPRLVLDDQQGTVVPPPGGPFDSTGVFAAFSGQSFSARVSYESPGQPNTNVFYGLLVSGFQTPLPTNITPPPLFTQPPFVLVQSGVPTLNVFGDGSIPLHVPLGVYGIESFVQAVTYDSSHSPALQLSNGVTISVDIPGFNVGYSFLLDPPGNDNGTFIADFGTMQLPPELLSNLKPLGTVNQPVANVVELETGPSVRLLPIVHSEPDHPVNPMAPPVTRTAAFPNGDPVTAEDTVIPAETTAGFPTRGWLLIAEDPENNPWDNKQGGGFDPPDAEVVHYDDITPSAFLGCERIQLGSNNASGNHAPGATVVGRFSAVTTAGARTRERIGTDFTNRDTPHVVIPPFDVGGETRDLDLYLFELSSSGAQGFLVLDRTTQTWEVIEESLVNPFIGSWDPVVHVAPDGKSFVGVRRIDGGVFGWDNRPDEVWTYRLDGEVWPATGTRDWEIDYETGPDPGNADVGEVRSREVVAETLRIINTNPQDFVLYFGLAYKFKPTNSDIGLQIPSDPEGGFETEWLREEVIVKDVIECGLVPPGSSDQPPSMPRPYMDDFPTMGNGDTVDRYDPLPLVSDDRSAMFWVAGSQDRREDAYVVRAATIASNGEVSRLIINMSGYTNSVEASAGVSTLRMLEQAGGRGRRAAFSPDGSRVAWVAQDGNSAQREWLHIGRTSGADFGTVDNVYGETGQFEEPNSPYASDRIITNIRWAGDDTVVFMMGKNDSNDPLNLTNSAPIEYDLFAYTLSTETMVNLTRSSLPSGSGASGFTNLGRIVPAGSFGSDSGDFLYYVRGGRASVSSPLPGGTKVSNIIGVNVTTLEAFDVSGQDVTGTSLIPDIRVPDEASRDWPITTPWQMQFTEAEGAQDGRIYFTGRRIDAGGDDTGRDDLFVLDRDFPFLAFPVTETDPQDDGAVVTNITADPERGRVAFARTFPAEPDEFSGPLGPNQHLYVVDLDQFLFERDVMSNLVAVGNDRFGRVMDGSVHFIPPVGSASSALVFSLGFDVVFIPPYGDEFPGQVASGIAQIATPIYYSLASVSDPVTEPTPLLIPLVDTLQFGLNYRFYVPSAGPYVELPEEDGDR